ncbi:MAG: nitroreductase family deazaflavin-dependent oxidoreductase [Acidimicrobiales bacterium]
MLVALTGGSGFVGSHTTVRLIAHGHRPRLLVRDPVKAARVLEALEVDLADLELVVGDMTDRDAVNQWLEGADAVIHAAAAIGVTGPRTDLLTQNVLGVENVVGASVELGIDPVIHVSTVAVFVPPDRPLITPEARLSSPRTDYGRSKLVAERYVRRLQDDGASVTIVYPGGVLGPGQPTLDALMEGLAGALGSAWPMPSGGVAMIHVEDLAEVLARLIEPGRAARRFTLGGDFLHWPELADLCDDLTGVRCRRMVIPGWAMIALGAVLDAAKRIRPFAYPLTRDAAEIMVTMVPTDDSAVLLETGVKLRPVAATVEEALRCLAAEGHLAPEKAGRLAPPGAVVVPNVPARERVRRWLRHHVVPRITGSSTFTRFGPKIVPRADRLASQLSGGRFTFTEATQPTLVLVTTGARSGQPRSAPLACVPEPSGSWLVVGSNFGREKHPAWTGNLLQDPTATVTRRGTTTPVHAVLLEGAPRDAAWADLMRMLPVFDGYEDRSGRDLRVFRLTPAG